MRRAVRQSAPYRSEQTEGDPPDAESVLLDYRYDRFAAWPEDNFVDACNMFEAFRLLLSWEQYEEDTRYGTSWFWEYVTSEMWEGDHGYTSDEVSGMEDRADVPAFIQDEFDRIATLSPPFESDCYEEGIANRWCNNYPSRCDEFRSLAPSLGLPPSIAMIIHNLLQDDHSLE
jgi:hypothetical protein